uniref:Uncharacterized protein n=1 Tax=Chlamydomonas euryale TaxID=1486919 RepID=A0A7R9V8K9_9CHLO
MAGTPMAGAAAGLPASAGASWCGATRLSLGGLAGGQVKRTQLSLLVLRPGMYCIGGVCVTGSYPGTGGGAGGSGVRSAMRVTAEAAQLLLRVDA